jgi:hypothetical protein
MTVQRIVLAVAGTLVLVSILLSLAVSQHFLWVTAFVGANLLQSAFSRWCLLASILRRAGVPEETGLVWRRGKSPDLARSVQLAQERK